MVDGRGRHPRRAVRRDPDIDRARRVPSFQLTGSPERTTLDLNALTAMEVKLVGRLAGIGDGKIQFSGSLRNMCALSDLKMGRLLDAIDAWAAANGIDRTVDPPHRLPPTEIEAAPPLALDLPKRHQDDHLGNRFPSRLLVARSAGPRSQGADPP